MKFSRPDEHLLIIKDTPISQWVFIGFFIVTIGFSYLNDGPWWMYAVPGMIILMFLANNSDFSISSMVDAKAEKFTIRSVGLFGKHKKEFDFAEIIKCEIQSSKSRRERTPSHSLILITEKKHYYLVHSTKEESIFQVLDILQEIVGEAD